MRVDPVRQRKSFRTLVVSNYLNFNGDAEEAFSLGACQRAGAVSPPLPAQSPPRLNAISV